MILNDNRGEALIITEHELNQLFFLNKETQRLQNDLSEIRSTIGYKSVVISDMPKGGTPKTLDDYIAEMVDLEKIVDLNLRRIQIERARLERYIGDIKDAEIRLIMRLRHINGMTWDAIGAELMQLDSNGCVIKEYDRTTISKKYRRYLKKSRISH